MALSTQEIYYIDVSKIGRDLAGSKDVTILYNEQALLESVTNIVATEPGERIMNPEFGCRLSPYIFEPIDDITATYIKDNIEFAIRKFEPRVNDLLINIQPLEDLNTFSIDIIFNMRINNPQKDLKISVKLNKIR